MAFHVRCNFIPIGSYAAAVRAWKKGVILHNDSEGPRGLVNKRKRMTVELTAAEDVILRLYEHPVVTWHKDNSITFDGYNTRSTIVFANHCMPAGMSARLCGGRFVINIHSKHGWRTYKVVDTITFRQRDNNWRADKITPWMIPTVNRARAKQALSETNYSDFRAWLLVYVQMAQRPPNKTYVRDKLSLLRDRSAWRELAACYPEAWRSTDQALEDLRKAIYHEHGCIDEKPVAFLG